METNQERRSRLATQVRRLWMKEAGHDNEEVSVVAFIPGELEDEVENLLAAFRLREVTPTNAEMLSWTNKYPPGAE